MTRNSPNKRKSVGGATPAAITPKKQKIDETPAKTPKSAKKGKKLENGEPVVQTPRPEVVPKTPKSAKKGKNAQNGEAPTTPVTATTPKSPKSGKKGKNAQNGEAPATPVTENAPKTPKTGKKGKNAQNGPAPTTPEAQKTDVAPKTPKTGKKGQKAENGDAEKKAQSPKKGGKLPKFEGTKNLGGSAKPAVAIPEDKIKGLNKRQRKRLIAKLKKKALIEAKKSGAVPSVAKATSAELNQTEGTKKNNKKNKKEKNILNKSLEEAKPAEGKKNKKGKGANQPKVEEPKGDEDESDYEVESQIKPEKITKKMNEAEDSDDDEDDMEEDDSEEDDDEEDDEEEKPQKGPKAKKQIELRDLNDTGLVQKGQSRYVLYVNNLPYDATKDTITEHFAKACALKDVRIPTDKVTKKPKGFAYIEVDSEEAYQKALSIHHTFLSGRRINVQYTQPGAKNSPNKKNEIKKKNLKLQGMRKQGMLAGSTQDSQKRSVRRAKKKSFDKDE